VPLSIASTSFDGDFGLRIDRVLTVASLSILFGFIASALLWWWAPFSDPIDIIGLPLILGYSESTEQRLVLAFVCVSFLSAFSIHRLIVLLDRTGSKRWCDRICAVVGTVGLVFWITLPFWPRAYGVSLLWCLGYIVTIIASRVVPRLRSVPESWCFGVAIGTAVLVSGQYYVESHSPSVTLPILLLIAATVLEWGIQGFRISNSVSPISVVRIGVVFSLFLLCFGNQSVAVFVGLTVFAFISTRRVLRWNVEERFLLLSTFLIGLIAVPEALDFQVFESLMFGILLGWLAEFTFDGLIDKDWISDPSARTISLLAIWTIPIVLHSTFHPVWLMVATLLVLAIDRLRNQKLRIALAVILFASCFLHLDVYPDRRPVDPLHDGQIISAVWQWKQGEILFDEVFPLRLTEFTYFATFDPWIGDSRTNYVIAWQILLFFGPLGVFALVLGMTESISWSWVTALFVGALFPFEYRVGTCMLLLGIAAYFFRTPSLRAIPLFLVGIASMWLGYDAWGTVMGAIGAAMLVTPPGERIIPLLWTNVLKLCLYACVTIGVFVVTLAVWQGWRAVQAYFSLFLEYAKEYPAFYGYPAFRSFSELQSTLIPIGIALACGCAWIIYFWREMSLVRRRHMVILMFSTMLFAHRAMSRSDFEHLRTLWYPLAVFVMVSIYWLMEFARGQQRQLSVLRPFFGLTVLVMAVHVYNGPAFPPLTWLGDSNPEHQLHWPPANADIASRLDSNDAVWEIQYGMWPFIYHRINPTRHSLAYCMGWPKETNRALRAMEEHPPKVVAFKPTTGIDHIPSVLWNPAITQFLYEHYRPVRQSDFLEPSPNRWREWSKEYEDFSIDFHLRELPVRWGRSLDHFSDRIEEKQAIEDRSATVREGDLFSVTFHVDRIPTPRDHFLIHSSLVALSDKKPLIIIEFAGADGEFDEASKIELNGGPGDGAYLIPVGLNPAWSWRDRISAIKISFASCDSFSIDRAELWKLRPAE